MAAPANQNQWADFDFVGAGNNPIVDQPESEEMKQRMKKMMTMTLKKMLQKEELKWMKIMKPMKIEKTMAKQLIVEKPIADYKTFAPSNSRVEIHASHQCSVTAESTPSNLSSYQPETKRIVAEVSSAAAALVVVETIMAVIEMAVEDQWGFGK